MFIPDPDFYPSRIPVPGSRISDPGSKNSNKREGWKKIKLFSVATNFTELNIILFLKCWRKIWAKFQRIIEVFTQKIVTKLSKIWVWDTGSGKKTYYGSRIQGSKRHRIPYSDPQHWRELLQTVMCIHADVIFFFDIRCCEKYSTVSCCCCIFKEMLLLLGRVPVDCLAAVVWRKILLSQLAPSQAHHAHLRPLAS